MMAIIKKGFVQCMKGEELWVNTLNDELITLHIKDREIRHDLYSKYVKVTIEVIDESEITNLNAE